MKKERTYGTDFVYMQRHADGEALKDSEIIEVDTTSDAISKANAAGFCQVNTPPPMKQQKKDEVV